jgi:hypothetical protein
MPSCQRSAPALLSPQQITCFVFPLCCDLLDRSLWESTCLARHSCDRCASLVDACVGRLWHAVFALLLFGSVVYAEYTSRQSPVHSPALLSLRSMPFAVDSLNRSPVSAQPLLQSFCCESMPCAGGRLSFSLLNSCPHTLCLPLLGCCSSSLLGSRHLHCY